LTSAPPLLAIALEALALIAALALATWLASVSRRDASLVDRMWPVFIASAALVCWSRLSTATPRGDCMLALALVWALRLGVYITVRNWGHGEDRRYRAIRARHEPGFALKSLVLVFALQALLAWIVAAPFLVGMAGARPFGALDAIGAVIAAIGVAFEAIGDAQMARFKADPAQRGAVMDRGLWRYTRHPNYFGEACVWWGLALMALAAGAGAGAWCLVSPLLMTVLLLKVSGVSLLEQDIGERRPAYRDYVARTPAFVPRWRPRAR
jgi:steroid 5-alpha reductase family enzyme